MPAILGPRMAADLVFAVGGMNANGILNFQNRSGMTAQQIIERAAAAAGGANQAVMDRWGGLSYMTEETHARYRAGVGGTPARSAKRTEAATTDPKKGQLSGHMLPLSETEYALAWTVQYLRDSYEAQIDADIAEQVSQFQYDAEVDFLRRALSKAENAFAGGYDVPWAIGTGVTVSFIPPQWQSVNFDNTHTHFKGVATSDAAARKTLRDDMMKDLRHHGIRGVLAMFVSDADVDLWAAVEGFVQITPANIATFAAPTSPMRVQVGQLEGVPGELFGLFHTTRGTVELRSHELIPANYCWMTKSYGVNNPENGLAVRVHPDQAFGMTPNPQVDRSLAPRLESISLNALHGIGVNKRLNGVAGMVGNATYTSPTIG